MMISSAMLRLLCAMLAVGLASANDASACGDGTEFNDASQKCVAVQLFGADKQIPTMTTEKGGVSFSVDGAKLSLTPDYTCYSSCEDGISKPCAGPNVEWNEASSVCESRADFMQIGDHTINLNDIVSSEMVEALVNAKVAEAVALAVANATAGLPEKLTLIDTMELEVQALVDANYPAQVATIQQRVKSLEDVDTPTKLSGMDTRVKAMEALDLGTETNNLKQKVSTLEGLNVDNRLTTLESLDISNRLNNAESDLSGFKALDIATNLNKIAPIVTDVANLKAASLDSRLATAEADVAALKGIDAGAKLAGYNARIGVLESADTATKIAGVTSRVGALEGKNFDTSVSSLSTRVKALEDANFGPTIQSVGGIVTDLAKDVDDNTVNLEGLAVEVAEIRASSNQTLLVNTISSIVASGSAGSCNGDGSGSSEPPPPPPPTGQGTKNSFINWGRQDCPAGTILIAKGWHAGGHDGHQGSTTSQLCMMYDPEYLAGASNNQNGNLLYRSEYQTGSNQIPSLRNVNAHDIACAVCGVPDDTTVYMVPAVRSCPVEKSGILYEGYLMAKRHDSNAGTSEFICMNKDGQAIPESQAGIQGGNYMYPTETESPPLGITVKPYYHDSELTCVVCKYDEEKKYEHVQWGVDTCSGGAIKNYDGWAGSGHYNHYGGGVSFHCMPPYAEYSNAISSNENGALIYVGEYETSSNQIPSIRGLHDKDIPCASCTSSGDSLWIPGKRNCPSQFNKLYEGYVMGSHYTHKKSYDWLCVDVNMKESRFTANGNGNGALLYPTETEYPLNSVGSGAKFQHDREVTCVMCGFKDSTMHSYIRWGRDDCVSGTSLVYEGWTGNTHLGHHGSGNQFLCMINDGVEYSEGSTANQDGALIYSTEYETSGRTGMPAAWLALHNREVPCAVCQIPKRTRMFVGKTSCPEGMNVEYAGYLMGSEYTSAANVESICVDKDAEGWRGTGNTNTDHSRLYFTETESPPRGTNYLHDVEVTCVVCSHS